jgi:hypothetical protein
VQVSVANVQDQFVPAIAVAVKPAGKVSLIVTAPDVVEPPLFVTVIEYAAPLWPWTKLPEWLLLMVRSGAEAGDPAGLIETPPKVKLE